MSWEQATGISGVLGGLALGWLGYRRSRRVDVVSAQSGIATEARAGTAQIIGGLESLIALVQADNTDIRTTNRDIREAFTELERKFDGVLNERDACKAEIAAMKAEIAELRRKYT